jgi:beta-lactamase superfamily II metal-dependent hydrolase
MYTALHKAGELASKGVGKKVDVICPPPDKLYSETNDNSIGILLTLGTARVLLAGDAEKKTEEYMEQQSLRRLSDRHRGLKLQNEAS